MKNNNNFFGKLDTDKKQDIKDMEEMLLEKYNRENAESLDSSETSDIPA